jgi:PAS domain-containing protein
MRKSASPRKRRRRSIPSKRSDRELIRAQEALERKTEELANTLVMMRATLESTTDAIVVTDGTAKITGYNQKYVEMLKASRDIIEGGNVRQLREMFSRQFKDPQQDQGYLCVFRAGKFRCS